MKKHVEILRSTDKYLKSFGNFLKALGSIKKHIRRLQATQRDRKEIRSTDNYYEVRGNTAEYREVLRSTET